MYLTKNLDKKSRQFSWEYFMLMLSLYVLIELTIEIIYPISEPTLRLLEKIDFIICIIFQIDFFYFLYHSDNKKKYLKTRWIDFVSSIPFIGLLRCFRLAKVIRVVRLLRVFRILRASKAILYIIRWLSNNKMISVFVSYILILTIILFFSSLAMYSIEKDINDNINEFFDAFWWSFITVTSVGYGDIYPVTKLGKVIAMVLTLSGMGLFSLITAELSAKFICQIRKGNI